MAAVRAEVRYFVGRRPGGVRLVRRLMNAESRARGDRGLILGWSDASARSNQAFLQMIEPDRLPVGAYWVTLTCGRDVGPAEWRRIRKRMLDRLARSGMSLCHWVSEFQRSGRPHLHMLVWGVQGWRIVRHWLAVMPEASVLGQHIRAVRDAGVLRYLAKHGARGVANYQRLDKSTLSGEWSEVSAGRMWGVRGDWRPFLGEDRVEEIGAAAWYALRRRYRAWSAAGRRATGGPRLRFSARRNAGIGDQWDAGWLLRGMPT